MQFKHSVVPFLGCFVPFLHSSQVLFRATSAAAVPTAHFRQRDLPASALNFPGIQGKHDADAVFGWYLPDGQSKPIILLLFKLKKTETEKVKNVLC